MYDSFIDVLDEHLTPLDVNPISSETPPPRHKGNTVLTKTSGRECTIGSILHPRGGVTVFIDEEIIVLMPTSNGRGVSCATRGMLSIHNACREEKRETRRETIIFIREVLREAVCNDNTL